MSTAIPQDQIAEQLQRTGMSGYEAKAYLALVGAGVPLNGYEVAKRSGVPRSTVYETLRKLVSRSIAFEVRAEDGVAYLPLQPDTLVSRLRREFEASASFLETALPHVTTPPQATVMHQLQGRAAVLERAQQMIAGAKEDLWLSIWPQEAEELSHSLKQAEDRGVEIVLLVFDEDPAPHVSRTHAHRFFGPETVFERVGCRLLCAVADRRQALIGGAMDPSVWAVYSEDPAVILVLVEYITHDISYQFVSEQIGPEKFDEIHRKEEEMLNLATSKGAPALRRR